jgi:hypothetical protein
MPDARSTSRLLGAFGLVAGPILFLLSNLVSPAWADDSAAYLDEVAAAPDRHVASGALFLAGALAFVPGLIAVARLLRGRALGLGQIGALLIAVAGPVAGGLILAIDIAEVAAVEALDRTQAIAFSERAEDSTTATVAFFGLFLGGFAIGTILVAYGLFRRRVVPVWSPVLLVAWLAGLFFLSNGRLGSTLVSVVGIVAFLPVAAKLLAIPDEQWERWEPAPPEADIALRRRELHSSAA